jgi:folate-binding protein YgfZ
MTNTPNKSAFQSPLYQHHIDREAFMLPYGAGDQVTEVVETFGDLDMEYAAIRKGCVIFDQPHIGSITAKGCDRGSFLNNMITAKVDDLSAGKSTWSFWLNRKGRIDADLRISQREDDMIIALDRHLCKSTVASLDAFVFSEDIELIDSSLEYHRIAIHGPTAIKLLTLASSQSTGSLDSLGEHEHLQIEVEGASILVERQDLTGEIGLELCIPSEQVSKVYIKLIALGEEHPELKVKESGWMAINAARIEAGHPMYNLDFGETNLPVESGIIDQRVNFAKGCYLGQEVVARMHARGACNKRVVALKIENERVTTENPEIHQPTTGSQIFEQGKEGETPIGVVTSSTISPMLGAIPICFAIIKNDFISTGNKLSVSAEGKLVECTVQETLVFWKKATSG